MTKYNGFIRRTQISATGPTPHCYKNTLLFKTYAALRLESAAKSDTVITVDLKPRPIV